VATLNRAERRGLAARLRADEVALNVRIEEIQAELNGMQGTALHTATMERLAAEGWSSERLSDLSETIYELANYESRGERMGHALIEWGLWICFFLLVVATMLRVTGVISHGETIGEAWFLGSVAVVAVGWLMISIGDRRGW
jgi:hypothetical protein